MAVEQLEEKTEEQQQQPKSGRKTIILIGIIAVVVILAGVGGYFGYTHFVPKGKGQDKEAAKDAKAAKGVLIPVDAFVVNLSDPGRYLKVTMQLEIDDPLNQPLVTEKMPKLRDAIITLLSSKSSEAVAGPEGKFQLKDELLLRVNQAVGKDVIRNLYFTDFVMQ